MVPIARAYEAMGLKVRFYSTESIFDLVSEFRPSVIIALAQNVNRTFVKVCQENPWIKIILLGPTENEFTDALTKCSIKVGRPNLRPCVDIIQFNGACGKPHLKCRYLICENNTPEIRKIYHDNKLDGAISIRLYGRGWGGYGSCGIVADSSLRALLASCDIFVTTRPDLVLASIICMSKVVYEHPLYGLKNIYKSVENAEQSNFYSEDITTIINNHTSFHVANELINSVDFDLSHKIPRFEFNQ